MFVCLSLRVPLFSSPYFFFLLMIFFLILIRVFCPLFFHSFFISVPSLFLLHFVNELVILLLYFSFMFCLRQWSVCMCLFTSFHINFFQFFLLFILLFVNDVFILSLFFILVPPWSVECMFACLFGAFILTSFNFLFFSYFFLLTTYLFYHNFSLDFLPDKSSVCLCVFSQLSN